MKSIPFSLHHAALALALTVAATQAHAHPFTSASVEAGTGDRTKMVRFGLQSAWEKKWFASNGSHLGGYWDVTLSGWRGNRFRNVPGQHQTLADIGLTPVWRWQRDDKRGLYFEGAVGIHLLSKLYDNDDNQLSTSFQFGDHIGIGYVFNNKVDLGLKIQHFSNGSIKKPNDGVNFIVAKASWAF